MLLLIELMRVLYTFYYSKSMLLNFYNFGFNCQNDAVGVIGDSFGYLGYAKFLDGFKGCVTPSVVIGVRCKFNLKLRAFLVRRSCTTGGPIASTVAVPLTAVLVEITGHIAGLSCS